MKEIKVAENKTLKLTNVLSREIHPEEMASLPVVLTQMPVCPLHRPYARKPAGFLQAAGPRF